jgi:hypothetical protein
MINGATLINQIFYNVLSPTLYTVVVCGFVTIFCALHNKVNQHIWIQNNATEAAEMREQPLP